MRIVAIVAAATVIASIGAWTLHGDTVMLAGFDTTWSLTARRPWR